MLAILQKYCQSFTKEEKTFVNKIWLNIDAYPDKFYTYISSKPDLHFLCILCEAIKSIHNHLIKNQFYSKDNFISACSAFISILSIYMINKNDDITSPKFVEKIHNLIQYCLLYIHVDHTLDSNKEHLKLFKTLFKQIINKKLSNLNDEIRLNINDISYSNLNDEKLPTEIQISLNYLINILEQSPNALPHIIEAANVEFDTIKNQSNDVDPLKTCYLKGETSAIAGCSIMTDGEILEGANIMGRLGQLYDDIIDVEQDLSLNIQTPATQCFLTNGNVDSAIEIFALEFEKLPPQYSIIQPLILYCFSTLLSHKPFISEKMRNVLTQYSLLNLQLSGDLFYFL
jgi:hypothetical protein